MCAGNNELISKRIPCFNQGKRYFSIAQVYWYKTPRPYFTEVEVQDTSVSQLFAICRKPIQWDIADYEKVFNLEWNMEYPNGYKHNQQEGIVHELLLHIKKR